MKLNDNIELLHGDCIDLLPKIPDESIDSIITDPPYFLGMTHNGQKGCFNDLAICKPFYEKLFTEYKRVLKPDGVLSVWSWTINILRLRRQEFKAF